ncbi:MFS transporter [Mariniflexile litorale]|uniref:MFS transporter n=1 Tax=Mariniflexile litorale TaxID=3045158 RepID=A0AAU7EHU8_9FLAO|nr:MFS transporter [Mariniflexile sp. KMM 9835]MDQ8210852.1 MFS transporter [Mariniflexile sp. KMM 9835]
MPTNTTTTTTFTNPNAKDSKIRWTIVALLFFATTINYIDRQVIGLLKPFIEKDLHWTEADYGYIVTAFQIAYAIGLLISGRMLDKLGSRLGYTVAIIIWSIGAVLHAFVHSVMGFGIVRSILGIGEAANFPAAVKTVAEWFPKKDRALATGIFNSGATVGAILAPIIVGGITLVLNWKWAFIITGLLGFIWIVFWVLIYRVPEKHKRVSAKELEYILSDNDTVVETTDSKGITWGALFKYRQTYAICFSRFFTDWVWWFFLFWAPDFLNKTQNIDLKHSIVPLIIIYSMASIGGVFGGALSSRLIKIGKTIDFARKTAILVCAMLVLPLTFATQFDNLWIVVIIIGFATAAHQGWASNIFTIVSDIYPKKAVATMVGLSGFAGAIGGALAASFVGLVLDISGSYTLIFIIASTMYLLAWLILKIMIPQIKPIDQ